MRPFTEMLGLLPELQLNVFLSSQELIPGGNGSLGTLNPGTVSLVLKISNPAMRVFTVDGQKTIIPSKNHTPTKNEATYKLRVEIKSGRDFPFTLYPCNNIRVMIENGNHLELFEIAIIGQSGTFFLTIQRTFKFQVYRNQRKLACPAHAQWTSLVRYLSSIYRDRIKDLPDISSYKPATKTKPTAIEPGTAIVVWWNDAMQYGCCLFLLPGGKIVYARIREIEAFSDNLITFEPGEIIGIGGYDILDSEQTNFRYEVSGATKLEPVLA